MKAVTALDIQQKLMVEYHKKLRMPRYTPAGWFECDVFAMRRGQYIEYEIKMSRADFLADKKKYRDVRPSRWAPSVREYKHDLLAAGCPEGPAYFYFVTPKGLLTPDDIPIWAGHMEVEGRYPTILKQAPKLHKKKVDKEIVEHARGVCYYRYHAQLEQLRKRQHESTTTVREG